MMLRSKLPSSWNLKSLPLWMAWFWAVNLMFFPAWLFGNAAAADRIKALLLTILWIAASSILLRLWLKQNTAGNDTSWQEPKPERSHLAILAIFLVVMAALNLVPAAYPLTSSGDEAAHAGTFRGIGRNAAALAAIVCQKTSLPAGLLAAALLLSAGVALWLFYRMYRGGSRRRSLLLLAAGCLASAPLLWLGVDKLVSCGIITFEELAVMVRFPPLSKFLWLPFSLFGWNSVFVLRLPVVLCWLLSGLVMYRVAFVRQRSHLALLPAVLLLCIPGYFYYGHLVYLTSPMLLTWCLVLYFYVCYLESSAKRYLVLTAVMLNIGTILRVETSYLCLALLAHMMLVQVFQKRSLQRRELFDLTATGWMGLSFIPLWSQINPAHRPFFMVWRNLITPQVLLATANDYPLHIGIIATAVLIVCIVYILGRLRSSAYLSALPVLSLLMIGISYLLFTIDYMVVDYRMAGLLPFSREWQTANRFLVSWSPFIVLILSEGIYHLPRRRLRLPAGLALALVLLAQATFWAEPLTLPEFTSLRLRPGAEYPHLPEREVLQYVSQELAQPDTRILLSPHLAAGYFLDEQRYPGDWQPAHWAGYYEQTLEGLVQYCRQNQIDIVVLPLVWMNLPGTRLDVSHAAMQDSHFQVKKVFEYLGEPAVMVALFKP